MAAKAKYLFDQDFAPGANPAEKPIAPSEHAVLLGEAESKGFRDGFAAAETEGLSVAARRSAAAFEQIGDALDRLTRGLGEIERRVETEAIELACAIARVHEMRMKDPRTPAREIPGEPQERERVDVGRQRNRIEGDAATRQLARKVPGARLVLVQHQKADVPAPFLQPRQK